MTTTTTIPEKSMTAVDTPLHVQQAEGLRRLADMIEAHPELPPSYLSSHLYIWHAKSADELAAIARAALGAGATVDKDIAGKQYNVVASFGPIRAMALADRVNVCERVVTGTETVTRTVPDPTAPLVEVTETVEQVEWVCRPLLADQSGKDTPK